MSSIIKLHPNYWDVAEKLRTILVAEHDNIVATLEDASVDLPYDSVDIHIGHWKVIQHWPVIEITGAGGPRPWLAQAYVRDQTFNFRIFCGVRNVDRTEKDKSISTLAAAVMAVLDSRSNKNYTITVSGTSISVYDSGIEDVGTVTLNQGTMIAVELSYFAKVWFQIPSDIYV